MKLPTCDDYDPNSLSFEQALHRINEELQPIVGQEQVAIREAIGRVLAEDVCARINVPAYINSAMDGYAIHSRDLPDAELRQLTVVGTAFAGKPYEQAVGQGQCIRIFTGAMLPTGTDTVIMQEHVSVQEDQITITTGNQTGQHVRAIGEDLAVGQTIFATSRLLLPADIGLLASQGIPEVKVKRRLRVAFFSTGDELCALGEKPHLGQIYDSNRYMLHAALTQLGVEIMDMGIIRDKPAELEQAFLTAAKENDVIITSGGVSVGDADYVTDILRRIGQIHFWKIAIKPGKPLTFGKIQQATFFGLPGNPVSAANTFYQFVQPALHRLMGQQSKKPIQFQVTCVSNLTKRPGRLEFQRGILKYNDQGELVVCSTGKQGPGILSSMSQANCFIVLPSECSSVTAGSKVTVEPFDRLI